MWVWRSSDPNQEHIYENFTCSSAASKSGRILGPVQRLVPSAVHVLYSKDDSGIICKSCASNYHTQPPSKQLLCRSKTSHLSLSWTASHINLLSLLCRLIPTHQTSVVAPSVHLLTNRQGKEVFLTLISTLNTALQICHLRSITICRHNRSPFHHMKTSLPLLLSLQKCRSFTFSNGKWILIRFHIECTCNTMRLSHKPSLPRVSTL